MGNASYDMHVGCLLCKTRFLHHVHGRGSCSDNNDVRVGDLARLADLVVVLNGEGSCLLARQLGNVW
jgi:hypothetical protein